MAKAKKKIVKGEALVAAVDSAISVLINIESNTAKSIAIVDKDNRKLLKAAKQLSKKKMVLMKKKKNATIRVRKTPIADNKKALKAIVKEIASITKDAAKISTQKKVVLEELIILKSVAKRVVAYNKSLTANDKMLNKPKAKKKKRAKKSTVQMSIVGNQAAA